VLSNCAEVSLASSHDRATVTTEYEIDEDVPETIASDGAWLFDIMLNLLLNARKFTEHGSIKLSMTCETPGRLMIEVSDTGPGVAPCCRDGLFEPLMQHSTKNGGLGLGLYIVKSKATALGGLCGYSPNTPCGSTFWVSVPCKAVPTPAPPMEMCSGDDRTILIIDDTSSIRMMLNRILTKEGYTVEEAENGAIGLDKMCEKRYWMVFCDYMMPVMNGKECVTKFRSWERCHRPHISKQVICGLTAQAVTSVMFELMNAGTNYVLSKPVNKRSLLSAIHRRY